MASMILSRRSGSGASPASPRPSPKGEGVFFSEFSSKGEGVVFNESSWVLVSSISKPSFLLYMPGHKILSVSPWPIVRCPVWQTNAPVTLYVPKNQDWLQVFHPDCGR